MNEFMTCIKKYATFEGRASRREYWMFVLFYWVVCIILGIFSFTLVKITDIDSISAVLSGIFALSMLLPTIAVGARRLHDVNKSGWYLLIALIPLGIFYILWLACVAGDAGENMYGPAPVVNTTPVTDISPTMNNQ